MHLPPADSRRFRGELLRESAKCLKNREHGTFLSRPAASATVTWKPEQRRSAERLSPLSYAKCVRTRWMQERKTLPVRFGWSSSCTASIQKIFPVGKKSVMRSALPSRTSAMGPTRKREIICATCISCSRSVPWQFCASATTVPEDSTRPTRMRLATGIALLSRTAGVPSREKTEAALG